MSAKHTNRSARIANILVMLVCVLGMLLSIYAYHVEANVHSDPTFKALCDISEHMSCSKVFSSKYGTGFGIIGLIFGQESVLNQPNSVYGMVFYIIQALLTFKMSYSVSVVQLIIATSAAFGCFYLAYILMFVLHDLCVVCVSTYVLNAIILLCSIIKYKSLKNLEIIKMQKKDSTKSR